VRLAIFDLDNTLIAGDSDHAWGEFLVDNGIVDKVKYKQANDRFYADYERGELDIHAYLTFSLEPLTQFDASQLANLHQQFMRDKIDPMRLTKAEQLLQQHRAQGDYLLIITSTNLFITQPIADSLRVDHILATEAEIINGLYTGNIIGTPCYQEGKITRLRQWLTQADTFGFSGDMENCLFYSDSINDVPLMEQVDNPIAVDPDSALEQYAKDKNWKIISLRN
jgi:HAD superfamily hydrolase (TIGR01490 family)